MADLGKLVKTLSDNAVADKKHQELADQQLIDRTIKFAARLRQLGTEFHQAENQIRQDEMTQSMRIPTGQEHNPERNAIWDQGQQKEMQLTNQRDYIYRTQFSQEASILRDLLLQRLPGEPTTGFAVMAFESPNLAGPTPLEDKAAYLEALASALGKSFPLAFV